jgi:hypothetical protein
MNRMRALKFARWICVADVATLFMLFMHSAQEVRNREETQDRGFTLSIDIDLVQLAVSVLDKDGRPVEGLENSLG